LKILLYGINYSPEPVGVGKYSGELAQWLAMRGHIVHVITAPPYFPGWSISDCYHNRYSTESHFGVLINRCPLYVPLRPSGFTRLLHLATFALSSLWPLFSKVAWKPDLIICIAPAFFCAPGALLLGLLCGKRAITCLHIQDFELDAAFELGIFKGSWLRWFAEVCERRTLKSFVRVSSISSAMVQRLVLKGVTPSRTSLFPNWVNIKDISPQQGSSRLLNSYRSDLGIAPDQIVLMYSGSMNKKQGLELLVEVISQLADFPQLVWLLAGEGPGKADLVRSTEGFSQVIHLPLQPAERMNDWLNAADIHLLPQKAGAADLVLPSKLLGMLASGRPVVATSTPGSELAELASEAGACTTPGDSNAFADALRQLISDSEQRLMAGKRARKLAEERFGKNAVLERFEQQLLSSVESKRY
jgi:colanic acid biosynthesis glycosyl transferase WcaI